MKTAHNTARSTIFF